MPIHIEYEKVGDYLLPKISPPKETEETSYVETFKGKYGEMRRRYLHTHKPVLYTEMFMAGKLEFHLRGFNAQIIEKIDIEVEQLLKENPPPGKNATNLDWEKRMNMLVAMAEEAIGLKELVCE